MKELFDVELRDPDVAMTREELAEAMRRADVLVPTITDVIDAGLLAQAGEKLKLIANYGSGFDHIDVATARQRGILVSNTPGVVTEDTADMVMALMLAVTRRIPEGLQVMQAGRWTGWSPMANLGGRLGGRRLGILGMGRIGRPWRGGRGRSGCRSITTTASACARKSRPSWRRPIGKAWTRCWRGWTSCRSTARTRPRPFTC
jgi:glyoxylate reductase